MLKKILVLLAVAGVTSCALYKDEYNTPKFSDVESQIATSNTSIQVNSKWWLGFNDAKLNNLIESVMLQNANLSIALANLKSSNDNLAQARYSWLPSANVGLNNQQTGAINSQNNPISSTSNGYTFSFVPSYNLNIMQTIFNNQLAEVNVEAATASLDNVKLMLIGQAIGSYYMYNQLNSQKKMQQELITHSKLLVNLTRQQFEAGLVSQLALEGALAQLALAKTELELTNVSLVTTKSSIKSLVNNVSDDDYTMRQDFNTFSYKFALPESISSSVLSSRPDIKIAEANLKAANINIALARSVFFPTLSLTSTTGTTSAIFSKLFTSGTDFWLTQANANVPILNMSSYEQIQSSKGQYYASYYMYMQVVKNAFLTTYNDLSNYDAYQKIAINYEEYLNSSKHLYTISNLRYQEGLDSKMQYTVANIVYLNAAITYSTTKLAILSSAISLYQDFGAGYSSFNPTLTKVKK